MDIAGKEMPLVFVSGAFDDLRTADIRFLQEAARLGEVHVFLHTDRLAKTLPPDIPLKFPQSERMYMLENIRFVHTVHLQDTGSGDSLPMSQLHQSERKVIWAIRDQEFSESKKIFCKQNEIDLAVVPDTNLKGFPVGESPRSSNAKKVMVSGCFDWVHSGHVRFFEEASQYGDLYVVVGHDDNLRLLKGEAHPLYPQDERRYWVEAFRPVHQALISTGHGWLDAQPEIEKYMPDIFIVNHDGDKPEKQKLFQGLGIEYLVLKRTPKEGLQARQSTNLRGF